MANPIVGSDQVLEATFRDEGGTLTNPSVITLDIIDPDGIQTEYTSGDMDNPSTGVFTFALSYDEAGVWRWRWEGTVDGLVSVDEGVVCVDDTAFVVAS